MSKAKKIQRRKVFKSSPIWFIPLTKINFIYFGIGMMVLVLGFYLMTIQPWDSIFALVISPILLLIGYFILFPLGILKKIKKES